MSAIRKGANPCAPRYVDVCAGREARGGGVGRALSGSEEMDDEKGGLPDEELFLRARAGDVGSLSVLIERHEARLFALLMRMSGGDRAQADDILQDTFLRAVQAARTFDADKSFRPWITAIAVNLFRDQVRRRRIRNEVSLSGDREGSGVGPFETDEGRPEARAEETDEAAKVSRALACLTEKERSVVLLHFYDGMTLQEVALTLDVPVGTAKSRLHSGLVRLRQILGEKPA